MSVKYSIVENLQTLLGLFTQKELSEKLGVNERTIRRWKNEGSIPKQHNDKIIREAGKAERKRISKHSRGYQDVDPTTGQALRKPIKPLKTKIQIQGTRRRVRNEHIGYRTVGRGKNKKYREVWTYRLSDYVVYEIQNLTLNQQAEMILALLKDGNYVRFLVRRPKSREYETGYETRSPFTYADISMMNKTEFIKWLKLDVKAGVGSTNNGKAHSIIADDMKWFNQGGKAPQFNHRF